MSERPVFTKGRDLERTAAVLRPWLAPRLGARDVEVGGFSYPAGAGVSNETILFEASWGGGAEELVLRVEPQPEYQLFLDTAFRMQFDLLAALHRGGRVQVPEVLWFEDDPSILGQRFFVMRRLRGNVPVSMPVYNGGGWLFDATPAQRRAAWESAMAQLIAIHQVPVAEVGFVDRPELGANGVAQQVAYWQRYATWALGDDVPDAVVALLDWLAERVPEEPPGLSWGDARIGNMMFGADFAVAGVMDWEQASLAGGAADLGWWLLFDDIHSVLQGLDRLDGLGGRQETIDLWEAETGLRSDNLLWHEAFAGCKGALLSLRTRQTLNAGVLGEIRSNPFLTRACELAGIALAVDA